MSKLEEAKEILSSLKVPAKQQNGMCCCVLLAMANLTEEKAWESAANNWIRIHDVIAFANSNYGTTYAENSRETFRKQACTISEMRRSLRITERQPTAPTIDIA